MKWSELLLDWYAEHRRDFPWRKTNNPYHIWLCEIILQQTRTQQGLPYYQRFIQTYPTVEELANAPLERVLKLWQGLGYYSRARNLHETAQVVRDRYQGQFPNTFEELLSLKGVGDYTASAIGSICFGLRQPVVDGNVYRVLSRFLGDPFPIDHHKALPYFKEKAFELMGKSDPAEFNQAIMEFGALHCTPKQPQCHSCPFQNNCVAHQTQKVLDFPQKKNRVKIRKRYFHYLVLNKGFVNTLLQKRTQKDIWEGLYEFPLLEKDSSQKPSPEDWNPLLLQLHLDPNQIPKKPQKSIQHKLSHQILHIHFWVVSPANHTNQLQNPLDPEAYPLPVPILNFVQEYFHSTQ